MNTESPKTPEQSVPAVASSDWLPCPFCGSAKITLEWEPCEPLDNTDTNRRWFAECSQCSCQGPFCQKEPQVRPSWNKRVEDASARRLHVAAVEFVNDWKKGDFELPKLAALDAESVAIACAKYAETLRHGNAELSE